MAGIFITDFAGMMPRASARLLANNQAQNAVNAKLWSGELAAYGGPLTVVTPTKVGTKKSIYRFGQDVTNEAQYWFHWTEDVDVVRAPINGDTSERTLWTGESVPRITDNSIALSAGTNYPMNAYALGIPKPLTAPSLATNSAGAGEIITIAATYTYVSGWGEEGPPSDASALMSAKYGDIVTIASMSAGPAGAYNIVAKRIYITITGSAGTDYQFTAEVPLATVSHPLSFVATALGEVLPSRTWTPPPAGLRGLTSMANGMIAGFEANNVWLCEPFMPHAWPARYRKSVPYGVVGLGTFDSMLVVLTKGGVYAGSATSPGALTLPQWALGKACVAKRGIVSMPGAVVYPCADGLGLVSSSGWQLITDTLFTRDEWKLLVPESIVAYRLGSRYVAFYDTGTVQRGFIFDPMDPRGTFVHIDAFATAGYNDPLRDSLYLQIGADIKRWDAAAALPYVWKSKRFTLPRPVNMGWVQVVATSYPVTVKVYADGVLKATKTIANHDPARLPAGYTAYDYEVQLEGTANVRGLSLTETMREMKQLVA